MARAERCRLGFHAGHAIVDTNALGAVAKGFEQEALGAGQPGLAAKGAEFIIQCSTTVRVQVGGSFVQQE